MKRVLIESPYAGDVERNEAYARECMWDSLARGEAPFASHLLYTQVLNDTIPDEREAGVNAGFAWAEHADLVAVYVDFGYSPGMLLGMSRARDYGQKIEVRRLYGND